MKITRQEVVASVDASPTEGVKIKADAQLSWTEWFMLVEEVSKHFKRLIQVTSGRVIPGDTINGMPSCAEDWYKDIDDRDTVIREDMEGYFQVTQGLVKTDDKYWHSTNKGWCLVGPFEEDQTWSTFYRIMRKI